MLSLVAVVSGNETLTDNEYVAKEVEAKVGKRDAVLDTLIGQRISINQTTSGANVIGTIKGLEIDLGDLLAEFSQEIINGKGIDIRAKKHAALLQGGGVMVTGEGSDEIRRGEIGAVEIPSLFYVSGNQSGIGSEVAIMSIDYTESGVTESVFKIGTAEIAINTELEDDVVINVKQDEEGAGLFNFSLVTGEKSYDFGERMGLNTSEASEEKKKAGLTLNGELKIGQLQ